MKNIKIFILGIMASVLFMPLILCAQENTGKLIGTVIDIETQEPLSFVYLHLEEIKRTDVADENGCFTFENVPAGNYTLSTHRIGYRDLSMQISITPNQTTTVNLELNESVLSAEALVVTAGDERILGSGIEGASKTISGSELRKKLSSTLAQTLEGLPGLSSRSMGAAPSRPVIRGLGGKRVIILEDGVRTGDVSSTTADHAVTIDPISAEEIEIARGPAALQYGSNAIGGVINVVSNTIPTSTGDQIYGAGSIQGASVNSAAVGAFQIGVPVGSFALQANSTLRTAQNLQTPRGEIPNTDLLSTDNAIGFSYIRPWGYTGVSSSYYLNHYGIPPDPQGGHPNGVNIEMRKYGLESKTEVFLNSELFKTVAANLSYKNYFHREIEPGGIIGTEYGVLTSNASVSLRHKQLGFIDEGTWGIWGEATDYAISGTRTPNTNSYSLSGYAIEEINVGPLKLNAGLRFDYVNRIPAADNPDSRIGNIRQRHFSAISGAFSFTYALTEQFYSGISLLRSFRAPSSVELYSQGPHLAAYYYEVGNPNLDPERGLGTELFFEYQTAKANARLSFYRNAFDNYIFPRNTGEPSIRFPTLNVYQFTATPAQFYGFETSAEVQFLTHFAFTGSVSYTYAKREVTDREQQLSETSDEWEPLPLIPSLQSSIGLKYSSGAFQIGTNSTIAAEQTRTGKFETPTNGYIILGLSAQYNFQTGNTLHVLSLQAENIFNQVYRNHLSRIKEIQPQPGRNISLLYRIYF